MGQKKKTLKAVVAALKANGYDSAVITYEGSGDSGQIEYVAIYKPDEVPNHGCGYRFANVADDADLEKINEIQDEREAFLANTKLELPVTTAQFDHEKHEWVEETKDGLVSLHDALESLAYEWLEANYGGWEINEGAYGTVRISVEEMRMEIEHWERVLEVNVHTDEFSFDEEPTDG